MSFKGNSISRLKATLMRTTFSQLILRAKAHKW